MKKQRLLQPAAILFTSAGILTLVPGYTAHAASILGYQPLCPFAPISTVLTLYVGVTIHRYLASNRQ